MDLSLDDLIAKNKTVNRRGGVRGRGRGGFRNGGQQQQSRPVARSPAAYHSGPSGLAKEINAHKKVRINISNLAPSVCTRDLEELFAHYNLDSASVNYGEGGDPLGTGDIVLSKRDAHRVLNDFHGVTVDNQRMVMILVEDSVDTGNIFNRIKLVGRGGGGVQQRRGAPVHQQQQRRGGFVPRGQAARPARGAAAAARGGKREKKVPQTEADLDAELDAYMAQKKSV